MQEEHLLSNAYRDCRKIALGHYENFPVGSILIPRRLRKHFFALYAFMRTADDFADLPHRTNVERLRLLGEWRDELHYAFAAMVSPPKEGGGWGVVMPHENHPPAPSFFRRGDREPIFIALHDTVRTFQLPLEPFDLLLDAFEFDARGDVRFETYEDLHWYTIRSAEPVGQLVLALFGYRDSERIEWSNKICSTLQLINFLQDAKEDLNTGRCYFPREAFQKFGINRAEDILSSERTPELVLNECDRIEHMLEDGPRLIESVQGRLKWELRAVLGGAHRMLAKIRTIQGRTNAERPVLSKKDWLEIVSAMAVNPRSGSFHRRRERSADLRT